MQEYHPLSINAARNQWVAVNKQSGLLSVPGKGPDKQDCVAARVARKFPHATGPLIAHRLDMDTSGLIVLGLTPDTQRHLSMQFQSRQVRKRYIALVEGEPPPQYATIDLPLRLDVDRRPLQIVDHLRGKPAQTHCRKMAREENAWRVEFIPETGRTHQLRVHAATPTQQGGLGCPILGDILYDGAPAPRLMLHASYLEFTDPTTGEPVSLECPPPF